MVYALIATIFLESLLYEPHVWRYLRRKLAFSLAVALPTANLLFILVNPNLWAIGIATVSLMRIVNLLRIVVDRVKERRLWESALRTSGYLLAAQTLFVLGAITY